MHQRTNMGVGLVRTNTNVPYLALLNTKESLTVTTGPSSGHSESWYCPQSSHPARKQTEYRKVDGKQSVRQLPSPFKSQIQNLALGKIHTYRGRCLFILLKRTCIIEHQVDSWHLCRWDNTHHDHQYNQKTIVKNLSQRKIIALHPQ